MKKIVEQGVHNFTAVEDYVEPKEQAVRDHLKWFMGLKLGFMMHWSPGSQMGTFESWPLSDGDGSWSQVDLNWADIETCKQQYREMNKTFNPIKFNAAAWADLAKDCGFKYLLFTTKHHDGFCMFDTRTTDYKITDPSCPFHTHEDADIVGALYREFRKRGLGISTYFSKPDWHSDAYWHRAFGNAPTRNVNYDVTEHPELWEAYVKFVHEQLRELGTNYGKIDVLWLDGGWVEPDNLGQDIRLGEIVSELRNSTQPHLIVANRTVGCEFENFVTPEQQVPETALDVPWETCVTVGQRFSFRYTDHFKSGRELVHLLLDIVSKGGSLALNIAPQPDGLLPLRAVRSLKELGRWLKLFGEGIYDTTLTPPYFEERLKYTRKGDTIYAFYLYDDIAHLPESVTLNISEAVRSVTSMRTGDALDFGQRGDGLKISTRYLPAADAFYAEGFKIELRK